MCRASSTRMPLPADSCVDNVLALTDASDPIVLDVVESGSGASRRLRAAATFRLWTAPGSLGGYCHEDPGGGYGNCAVAETCTQGGTDPPHRAAATYTRIKVGAEHLREQPGPSVSPRSLLFFYLSDTGELELITGADGGRSARGSAAERRPAGQRDPEATRELVTVVPEQGFHLTPSPLGSSSADIRVLGWIALSISCKFSCPACPLECNSRLLAGQGQGDSHDDEQACALDAPTHPASTWGRGTHGVPRCGRDGDRYWCRPGWYRSDRTRAARGHIDCQRRNPRDRHRRTPSATKRSDLQHDGALRDDRALVVPSKEWIQSNEA